MSYQVQGGPLGYLGKFVVAMLNRSPEIDGRLTFEHVGPWDKIVGTFVMKESQRAKDQNGAAAKYAARNWDDSAEVGCAVIVRGKLARSGQVAELSLDMRQCHPRNSTLWASDPQQQICYVAARRWADRFVPEVLMGMSTDAELGEDGMVDITPGPQKAAAPAPTNRLQHFVEQHQPPGATFKAAQRSYERADRDPPEKPEPPQHPEPSDKPKGTTQVELCLPSAVAGDVPSIQTVPVSQAAQALIDAAQGQSEEWIAAARDANPWTRRHRYTNTALEALEEVARAKQAREYVESVIDEVTQEYDRDTGELEV
jgi:hypothetical protein